MPSTTTNYGLYKPLVNDPTDQDLWGGYLNTNMDILDSAIFNGLANAVPVGTVIQRPSTVAPTGYVLMQGQLITRLAPYAALWTFANASSNIVTDAAWPSSKGAFSSGNGTSTFRLPDPRGLFSRVLDNGAGIDTSRSISTIQTDDVKPHNHTATVTDPGHAHNFQFTNMGGDGTNGGKVDQSSGGATASDLFTTVAATTGLSVAVNNSTGTETRPKNFAWPMFIKY